MKEKIYAFSVKIVAEIFSKADNILVDKIGFYEIVEGRDPTQVFKKVQKIIKQKATRRGYHNGYRFQYHNCSPLRKLWEGIKS